MAPSNLSSICFSSETILATFRFSPGQFAILLFFSPTPLPNTFVLQINPPFFLLPHLHFYASHLPNSQSFRPLYSSHIQISISYLPFFNPYDQTILFPVPAILRPYLFTSQLFDFVLVALSNLSFVAANAQSIRSRSIYQELRRNEIYHFASERIQIRSLSRNITRIRGVPTVYCRWILLQLRENVNTNVT